METETNKMISFLINKTIKVEDLEKFNLDKIFIIKRNGDKIETIDINAALVNEIVIDIPLITFFLSCSYLAEFPYSLLALTTDYIPPYLSLLCINHRY